MIRGEVNPFRFAEVEVTIRGGGSGGHNDVPVIAFDIERMKEEEPREKIQ